MVGCGSDDEPQLFVTMQTRQILADGFGEREPGCMSLSFGGSGPSGSATVSSAGFAPAGIAGSPASIDGGMAPISDGFGVERSERGEALRVFVFAGPQALAIKIYSKAFFQSGKTDRFEVTTPVGTRYELAHRGAHVCETEIDLFAQ
jgi:hypothetical protein